MDRSWQFLDTFGPGEEHKEEPEAAICLFIFEILYIKNIYAVFY
jgi:hypothetical protein